MGDESTQRVKAGGRGQFPHEDDAWEPKTVTVGSDAGRWPANVVHDGSDEVVDAFPFSAGQQRAVGPEFAPKTGTAVYGDYGPRPVVEPRNDAGSAARFFYTAKADAADRLGSKHPTVKPVDLMRWLVRLVTPAAAPPAWPVSPKASTPC